MGETLATMVTSKRLVTGVNADMFLKEKRLNVRMFAIFLLISFIINDMF